jgi:hypothetical protein
VSIFSLKTVLLAADIFKVQLRRWMPVMQMLERKT